MRTTERTKKAGWGLRGGVRPRGEVSGVALSLPRSPENPETHEAVTRRALARKLAALKGYEYGGDYDAAAKYAGPVYLVPAETLIGVDVAHALGIFSERDLFGGVVPFAFVATKSITHPLVGPRAAAPRGWSNAFTNRVRDAVLPGYTAFSREDAIVAGKRLLKRGAVRLKPSLATGGRGQAVVHDTRALEAAVAALDQEELETCGLALEQNLSDVVTFSVGQVQVADLVATYVGTQKLTKDHRGEAVYGGSDLTVSRGGFDALLALDIDDDARRAVEQARTYDSAARSCFPGFFASRCNYDMVCGRDPEGAVCCGVLEQSWRLGGASGAEVAALEAFRAQPALRAVRAECTEAYDEGVRPPRGATVYFSGVDCDVGFITKYTTLEPYVDA